MKEIDFILSEPLEYHNKGQLDFCAKLTLTAPTAAMTRYTSPIKKMLFSTISNQKDSKIYSETVVSKENAGDFTGVMVEAMLAMVPDDTDRLNVFFKDLCCAGVVKLPNGDKITSHLLDKISLEDFERLEGEYIANFIFGSLMKRLSQN